MGNTENLIKDITQKDENIAMKAIKTVFDNGNIKVFSILDDKSEFLFDFVKKNISRRISSAITPSNYKNLFKFFTIYSYDYANVLVEAFWKYADGQAFSDAQNLLKNGSDAEKTYATKILSQKNDEYFMSLVKENVFSDFEPLMNSCAEILNKENDKEIYEKALLMLNSNDDFEVLKGVKILVALGYKEALEPIYNAMQNSPVSANIAEELPFLTPLSDMLKSDNFETGIFCLNEILDDLAENIPLSYLFTYEIYDVIDSLININMQNNPNFSEIAMILAKAKIKFELITSNDEYIFDADKDTKNEVFAILNLLNAMDEKFWQCQFDMLTDELYSSPKRVLSVLEIIKELNLQSAIDDVKNLLDNEDETVVCSAVNTLKELGAVNLVNKNILDKFKNENLKVLVSSYLN